MGLVENYRNISLGILVTVLFIAFFLRTAQLGSVSFWLDEVHSLERASQQSWQAMYGILLRKNHAPLYALLLHHWIKLGDSEFVARFLSATLGVINVAATYSLGRELGSEQKGLVGAALLGLSPLHVYYSQEARMYVLAALLVTLSLYCLHRATRRGTRPYWAGYVLFSALSLYTHYYSAFTLLSAGMLVATIATIERKWNSLFVLAVVHLCVALLFAPWLPTFLVQVQSNPLPWLSRPSWEFLHRNITKLFIHHEVLGAAYPVSAAALVAIMAVPHTLDAKRKLRSPAPRAGGTLFAAVCTLGPIAMAVSASLLVKPIVFDRYFVLTAPIASVFLAASIVKAARFHWLSPLVSFLLAGVLVSAYGVVSVQWKENWEAAALCVKKSVEPGDSIVFGTDMHVPPFNHYYDGDDTLQQYALPTDWMRISDIEESLDNAVFTRFWMVQTERFNGNERIADHVIARYADECLSCCTFGGRYRAEVCLYSRRVGAED